MKIIFIYVTAFIIDVILLSLVGLLGLINRGAKFIIQTPIALLLRLSIYISSILWSGSENTEREYPELYGIRTRLEQILKLKKGLLEGVEKKKI